MAQVILTLARDNRFNDVRRAVEAGLSPVNYANQIGQTSLHIAALHGAVETLEVLIELGIDVNIQNQRGTTALHFAAAAKRNAKAAVETLLKAGADPYIVDSFGALPCERAEDNEVRQLLGGPDPKFFEYAEAGKEPELQELLEGADKRTINMIDAEGKTAVHLAVAGNHLKVLELLLSKEADPNARDGTGNCPLHIAVREGHSEVIEALIKAGADPKMPSLRLNHYTNGQWLSRENKETLEPFDQTALHIAVEEGDPKLVEALLKAGADVNDVDFDGKTPFHVAMEENDPEVLDLVLGQDGVDVNRGNGDYESPLHYLVVRGRGTLIRRLVESHGAKVDVANAEGWTPLHIAARSPKVEVVQSLLDLGCDPMAVNNAGNTALHMAAVNGRLESCKLLMSCNSAACGVKNNDGQTPADVAQCHELKELLRSS
mmetsp:Transcript_22718/g.63092  ORF Transcript_22718/g.63092 Transcript_22718/m.63092 type:complete len:432 (+) Transcript_22718:100-1395(+)